MGTRRHWNPTRPRPCASPPGHGHTHFSGTTVPPCSAQARRSRPGSPAPLSPAPRCPAPSRKPGSQMRLAFPTWVAGCALPGATRRQVSGGLPVEPRSCRHEPLPPAAVRAGHGGGWRRAAAVSARCRGAAAAATGGGWGGLLGGRQPKARPAHPTSPAPRQCWGANLGRPPRAGHGPRSPHWKGRIRALGNLPV